MRRCPHGFYRNFRSRLSAPSRFTGTRGGARRAPVVCDLKREKEVTKRDIYTLRETDVKCKCNVRTHRRRNLSNVVCFARKRNDVSLLWNPRRRRKIFAAQYNDGNGAGIKLRQTFFIWRATTSRIDNAGLSLPAGSCAAMYVKL